MAVGCVDAMSELQVSHSLMKRICSEIKRGGILMSKLAGLCLKRLTLILFVQFLLPLCKLGLSMMIRIISSMVTGR